MRKVDTLKSRIITGLGIILIPLIVCIVICTLLFAVLGNSLSRAEDIVFENASETFESDMETSASKLQMLTYREPFRKLAVLSSVEEMETQDFRTFSDSLANIKAGLPYVNKIAFIFKGNFVVSDTEASELAMFLGDVYYASGIEEEVLYDIYEKDHALAFYFFADKVNSVCVFDANNFYGKNAKIWLLVNNASLRTFFDKNIGYSRFWLRVAMGDQTFECNPELRVNSGKTLSGHFTGLRYSYDVPLGSYAGVYIPVFVLTMCAVVITFIVAVALTVVKIHKEYEPVKRLKKKLTVLDVPEPVSGDLEFIDKSVDKLLERHSDYENWKGKNRDLVLLRILRNFSLPDTPENVCREYGFPFEDSCITVVSVSSRQVAEALEELTPEEAVQKREGLSVIRKELAQRFFGNAFKACYCVDAEASSYLILCSDATEEADDIVRRVKECARNYQAHVVEEYFFYVMFAIGNPVHSLAQIHSAYRHAVDTRNFGELLGSENEIIDFGQIRTPKSTLKIDLSEYKKLQDFIREKDFDAAQRQLQAVIEQELTKLSKEELQCKLYALIDRLNTEITNATATFDETFLSELRITETLIASKSVKELLQNAEKLFTVLSEYVQSNAINNIDWISKVKTYIKENFVDNNLSVSFLADKFHFSLSYFSRVFKKETGKGVFDYLQDYRIKRAKELLEAGKSVSAVASAVGFLDSSSFIKAFKKKEGYTPLQHKHK